MKEKKKNILGLISGEERFISIDGKRQFNVPQTEDEFEQQLDGQDVTYVNIDPDLPDHMPRHKYIKRLNLIKSCLEKERDEKIEQATKLVINEYDIKVKPIKHAIEKLECIIFLKEICGMVILEDGKVK